MSEIEILICFCAAFFFCACFSFYLFKKQININKKLTEHHDRFLVDYAIRLRYFEQQFKKVGYNTSELDKAIKDFENKVISKIEFDVK